MSALENTARNLLTAMIQGEQCPLDAHQQRTLATWVHKTMLMMCQQAPASDVPVPKSHYTHMYRDKTPPTGTLVCETARVRSSTPSAPVKPSR